MRIADRWRRAADVARSAIRRRGVIIAIVIVVAVIVVPRLPPVRTVILTAALVPEMLDMGIRPLSAVTDEPRRETVMYGTPADRMDVYLPAGAKPGSRLPAVVLALGVHPAPIDDPTIVRLASAIARTGVVVGVPDSSALRDLRVTPAEPGHLADAALALAGRPEVDPTRVGLAGFSAGASICLVAAADPRLAGHLDFVSSFGGYADAERLLVDVASRTTKNADGTVSDWQPDPGIRHDVLELSLQALPDETQRDALRQVLTPYVVSDERPPASPTGQGASFTGDAGALYRLFTAPDRAAAETAVASLSPTLHTQLAGISPVSVADQIQVPVFLLHGVSDTATPVAHAALLRDAIGSEVVRLTEFGRFGHGQPGTNGLGIDDLGDIFQLALYLRDVVAAATE